MTRRDLVISSLRHYWRVNLAVTFGVGVAISALAGALVVGDSVRASLRELAVGRLGRIDHIVTANHLFTAQLADRLSNDTPAARPETAVAPVLALEGVVTHERTGTRAGRVQVYGVDDRFWTLNGVADVAGPTARNSFLSPTLARELGAAAGDALLLRVEKPSAIPAGLVQGRRNEPGQAIRLTTARVLDRANLGEFSPRPDQGAARAIFVPLARLQRDLEVRDRVNMLLVTGGTSAAATEDVQARVERHASLEDLGVRIRELSNPVDEQHARVFHGRASEAVESATGLLPEPIERAATDAARDLGLDTIPVLTYLATAIKANGRETPYSLVTALPVQRLEGAATPGDVNQSAHQRIWLTQWTADDLAARAGDTVTLDYYVWSDDTGLSTASAAFTVAGVLPMEGLAVDANLTPEYPGVSTSLHISDWDPPFPVDLKRIRPKDEEYWNKYRTAPKAFIALEDGQALWRSPYGSLSSLRLLTSRNLDTGADASDEMRSRVSARDAGFRVIPVREDALAAAAGTTDFGEYFTYFSFFLVVSSLLLTLLFFRLGIEQRAREIGLLAAMGFTPRAIRSGLMVEGAVLAMIGALLGVAGAIAYARLIMFALGTWWVDAVGTTDLTLHVTPRPLILGTLIGVLSALAFIAWSLRVLRRASARQLMSGTWVEAGAARTAAPRRLLTVTTAATVLAVLLVSLAAARVIPQAGAFFGSGTLLLIAGLCAMASWLRGTSRRTFERSGMPVAALGLRNARYRPSRSVLSVALIASATFLIVSVGAFRRGAEEPGDAKSSSGGYALIAESVVPLMHDPSTAAGRDALNLGDELDDIQVARFRLRPGDDASCLNLYRPQSPRLLGATDAFVSQNRFTFARSMAETPEEHDNPWRLLHRRFDDGAVPVIGDATSLTYVFHLAIGDDYVMQGPDGRPLTLRIVGALRDSVLQSELIMGDGHFTRLFPRNEGFRLFLVGTDPARAPGVAKALQDQLQDFGMEVQSTSERLASYHRVENTYLTTFQALGGLGLVLGTLGLGTVLLRSVLERRRELAVLQATGYRRAHLVQMVLAESLFLLGCGLVLGLACAGVAIAPVYLERAQSFPVASTLALLAAVLAAGLLSTVMATRFVATMPVLEGLKNE